MQRGLQRKIRFAFDSLESREGAMKELDKSDFRHLTTSTFNAIKSEEPCFYLFVQTTGSFIYDSVSKNSIEAIMGRHGGVRA